MKTTYSENPNHSFERAIASGILSTVATSLNFVSDFMYMGTEHQDHGQPCDLFKHVETRRYIRAYYEPQHVTHAA